MNFNEKSNQFMACVHFYWTFSQRETWPAQTVEVHFSVGQIGVVLFVICGENGRQTGHGHCKHTSNRRRWDKNSSIWLLISETNVELSRAIKRLIFYSLCLMWELQQTPFCRSVRSFLGVQREHSKLLTILSFIAPKVPPVAEHDLQVVTLIKSS